MGPASNTLANCSKFICAFCGKGYSSNSHLRRHEVTQMWLAGMRQHARGAAKPWFSFHGREAASSGDPSPPSASSSSASPPLLTPEPDKFHGRDQQSTKQTTTAESNRDISRIPIKFLLEFTNPSPYGTSAAVVADDHDQFDAQDDAVNTILQPFFDGGLFGVEGLLWDQGDYFPTLFGVPYGDASSIQNPVYQTPSPTRRPVLAQRASEMLTQLSMTYEALKNDFSESGVKFDTTAAKTLFTETNLAQRLCECRDSRRSPAQEIELLQAAYTIEIVQNGSSDVKTRRRIRLVRHPSLVAAMRIAGLLEAKRLFPLDRLAVIDWNDFVIDEMRVR
ncbi:hypothetical protein G7Z17_g13051 [Cylindrodendrum hubeiense]|uniref:C2H2-type domain-containing protein n=1 Tax=Cylindrodendrum hubeiense TaxID=595255 RepID=A0A9P5GUC4_9HYPO|nr:hypothetical protein G7Z17_g13051 [Cylindrodendrum hubeiense]